MFDKKRREFIASRRDHPVMDRRAFLSVVGGSILTAPFAVEAQLPTKTARIGVLSLAAGPNPIFMDLFRGLRELSWVDGKNMACRVPLGVGSQGSTVRLGGRPREAQGRRHRDRIDAGSSSSKTSDHYHSHRRDVCRRPRGKRYRHQPGSAGRQHHGRDGQYGRFNGQVLGAAHANGIAGRPDSGPLGSGRTPGTYQTKYARGARSRRASAGSAAGIHGYTAVR
jgi:hypothetical protein